MTRCTMTLTFYISLSSNALYLVLIPILDRVSLKILVISITSTYRVGSWWFWSTCLSGNNDLVDRKDSSSSLSGKLNCPALRDQKVKNIFIIGIESASSIFVLYVVSQFYNTDEYALPRYQHLCSSRSFCYVLCKVYSELRWHQVLRFPPKFEE